MTVCEVNVARQASLVARELAPSSINVRLSGIRKLALVAAENQLLAAEVAAAIGRIEGAR